MVVRMAVTLPIYFERTVVSLVSDEAVRPHSISQAGPAAAAKSLQLCPTLCDPIPGILQARTLEWVAISFSNA